MSHLLLCFLMLQSQEIMDLVELVGQGDGTKKALG